MPSNALNLILPLAGPISGAPSNPSSFTLNNASDYAAWIFKVPAGLASYSLTKGMVTVVTVTGTAPTFTLTLEAVDAATGRPDGTPLATVDFLPISGDAGHVVTRTFDVAYSSAAGATLALVMRHKSGTIDGSNSVAVRSVIGNNNTRFPYAVTSDSGGSTTNVNGVPIFGIQTAGGDYFGLPLRSIQQTNINANSSTSHELGNLFTIPATWFRTYQIAAVRVDVNGLVASAVATVSIYSGTTSLQTGTLDMDTVGATSGASIIEIPFTSLATLNTGTPYRAVISNSSTGSNLTPVSIDVEANADFAASPLGVDCYSSIRGNALGAWTDTNTRRVNMDLVLANITQNSIGGFRSRLINAG
ncbi:MAG: hypothetical protein H7Z14_06530 [Anaerolineae bacterium]|nr:hypothetical protein [Phycisphaerae bacterium]